MTTKFFYDSYKDEDLEIKKIIKKDNKLIINITMVAHLELIANGYRPELDVSQQLRFTFLDTSGFIEANKYEIKKLEYNDKLYIYINDFIIEVNNNTVGVEII